MGEGQLLQPLIKIYLIRPSLHNLLLQAVG